MFLSLDGTSWIQLINFAIFFVILNAVFQRPVGAAIRKRRAYIESVKSDFEHYMAEVKALRDEAEAKRLFGRDPGLSQAVREDYRTRGSPAKAEKQFLARFKALTSP